jgi:cytidyltransferase-like protein
MKPKVFVSGCFDMLHSGHIAFLTEVADMGQVIVGIGSDETVFKLKGRYPVTNQAERMYMLQALKCVYKVQVNSGDGILDFKTDLELLKPDFFVVNEDGHTLDKEALCKRLNIEYKVLHRIPHQNLPARSTTALRTGSQIPFRIDIAGGWMDQPFVSKHAPGSVITIAIEPTIDFNHRSGMSSSTRHKAIELWQNDIPAGNKTHLAKILFAFENPPGSKVIAGSQDSIGIVFPGLNRLDYDGNFWPNYIHSVLDEDILEWIEAHLSLITLSPRHTDYDVLANTNINKENVLDLANATELCWQAIFNKDIINAGKAMLQSFEAQLKMFPNMADAHIFDLINEVKGHACGYKLSGAGGGGYLIMFADKPVPNSIQIKIRRSGY